MNIDFSQIQATTERYKKRTPNRSRNERLIKQRRYFEADSPERVSEVSQSSRIRCRTYRRRSSDTRKRTCHLMRDPWLANQDRTA